MIKTAVGVFQILKQSNSKTAAAHSPCPDPPAPAFDPDPTHTFLQYVRDKS